MGTFTTIPAFKAGLLARLQADAGLAGVQVAWGLPFGSLARELVVLGHVRAEDPTGGVGGQSTASLGQRRREERYVLELVVRVVRHATQQEVTERAFAIAAEIEQSVRAWGEEQPQFGGLVRWALVSSVELQEFPTEGNQERLALVTVDLACAQRI